MAITNENKEKILHNNAEISRLLAENETILREEGFNPPEKNYVIPNKNKRINFPNKYVRTKRYFVSKYSMNEIILNNEVVSNIAYTLQMSDMNNYIMNRFNTFASIDAMIHKQSYLTIITVIEALVQGSINNVRKGCQECNEQSCKYRISKREKEHVYSALKKWSEMELIQLTDNELKRVDELFELRNKIHLVSSNSNEMMNGTFGLAKYNVAIMMLKRIDEELIGHIVPLYGKCMKKEKSLKG